MEKGFKTIIELRNSINKLSDNELSQFSIIKNIKQRIDDTLQTIVSFSDKPTNDLTPAQLSLFIMRKILIDKLDEKPGFDGFIINTDLQGNFKVYKPDITKINDPKTELSILKNISVASGAIGINSPETVLRLL